MNGDLNFEYGEGADARYGCGVFFKGEYFYFGGSNGSGTIRQVSSSLHSVTVQQGNNSQHTEMIYLQMSKIEGCSLKRQEDLPFNFYHGACNVFNQPQTKILLCFEYTETQKCHL